MQISIPIFVAAVRFSNIVPNFAEIKGKSR
jgi:hypothetical protein